MQKLFLGCFHTPSHLLQWHPGSSEILGFVSLMYTYQMITGWHGQAIVILQGPLLLLEVSRKSLPTTCIASLWSTSVPWWWMRRDDQTLLCYQTRKHNPFKQGKKNQPNKQTDTVVWCTLGILNSGENHVSIWTEMLLEKLFEAGQLHWPQVVYMGLFVDHSMEKDALSLVPCIPLVWSVLLARSPGRRASWQEERSVFDEICLPAHVSVPLHHIQAGGIMDLQGQEEESSSSTFITRHRHLGLWQLRGQHVNLLARHRGSEAWQPEKLINSERMTQQVRRYAGSNDREG